MTEFCMTKIIIDDTDEKQRVYDNNPHHVEK